MFCIPDVQASTKILHEQVTICIFKGFHNSWGRKIFKLIGSVIINVIIKSIDFWFPDFLVSGTIKLLMKYSTKLPLSI